MSQIKDPSKLEILKNSFEGIADGMPLTIVRTSRSSIVRSGLDFSTAVLSANGELVGQGMCQPIHLGGMMPALETCRSRYEGNINPGDIFINNDPYEGGSHLPDIFLYKPIFVGDTLVAYGCAMAHQTDIGGRVPGGNACDSTEIYQEGLRIPPLKLYENGEPNETIFRLLEKAVRVPDKVLGDVTGQLAALQYAEQEVMRIVEQYGPEEFIQYQDELIDYTETLTRNTLRSLPDGQWSFTDYIGDDGVTDDVIPIQVNLTKTGDNITVDFEGTGPQCKGAIQPVFVTTKAMVYAALKNVLGIVSDIPNTSGYFRPVTVTAPEGTFVNPLPPAPVAARNLGCIRIHQAVLGAFAQMLPDKIYACSGGCEFGVSMAGYDKTKNPWQPWIQIEFQNECAVGALPFKDGADGQGAGASNQSNIPIETMEAEQPIVVEEYGFIQDTEGAGEFRGGMGTRRSYRYTQDDTLVQVRSDRMKFPPFGVNGGDDALPTRIFFNDDQQDRSKFIETVPAGTVLSVDMPGAGGWGNPLDRDPALVLDDFIQEKISAKRAREKYGVVVDETERTVNFEDTKILRENMGR